jgi:hypothetical protein
MCGMPTAADFFRLFVFFTIIAENFPQVLPVNRDQTDLTISGQVCGFLLVSKSTLITPGIALSLLNYNSILFCLEAKLKMVVIPCSKPGLKIL